MYFDQNVTIINAGASVTPLNFRTWLKKELNRQSYSLKQAGGAVAYIFITKAFVTALAVRKMDKIIADAVDKHPWIFDVQVVTTDKPVTNEEAQRYIEIEEYEGPETGESEDEFGLLILGYTKAYDPTMKLSDIPEDPACVIRPITERDIVKMGDETYGYKVGDFAVMGGDPDKLEFSPGYATEAEAKRYAETAYGVVYYVETRGIT